MKLKIFSLLFFMTAVSAYSQNVTNKENQPVKWYTIQEAEKLMKQAPRTLFIDAYTDWCSWCKKMDNETFTNPVIANILNNNFYPVKFNAEGNESIDFLGQKFINDGKYGKAHQLAVALLQGQLSYPTVVFMARDSNKYSVTPVPGFMEPKEMEVLLSFFANKAYLTSKWEVFQKSFVGKVK